MNFRISVIMLLIGLAVVACAPAAATPTLPAGTAAPTQTAQPTRTVEPSVVAASPTPAATAEPTQPPSPTSKSGGLQLAPDSGMPGARVQIKGYVPNPPPPAEAKQAHANVCWTSCLSGLTIEGLPVQWSTSQPGQFTIEFEVPRAAWLASNGIHELVPGEYSVGVQCLIPSQIRGCALQEAQMTATFRLQGPTPSTCVQGPCGTLQLDPPQAAPGTLIHVSGWAPLTQIVAGQSMGYTLELAEPSQSGNPTSLTQVQQGLDGSLSGSFRVPFLIPAAGTLQPGKHTVVLEAPFLKGSTGNPSAPGITVTPLPNGGARVTLAPTTLTVAAAPAWSTLGALKPLWIEPSATLFSQTLASDGASPQRIAYCASDGIKVSDNAGKTWQTVPTAGIAQAAAAVGYPVQSGPGASACISVMLDPGHPSSYFATISSYKQPYGAPPVYYVGYVTTDNGTVWKSVPAPNGHTIEQFGGFREEGSRVLALFTGQSNNPDQAPSFTVEQTIDGGRSWTHGKLGCPTSGPCVRWGPAPSSVGGMGTPLPQWIEYSTDGGQTWQAPTFPQSVELRQSDVNELVALGLNEVALLSGASDYPFLLSKDGGRTWNVITLPVLQASASDNYPLAGALQILPNSSLIARANGASQWQLMPPNAGAWCALPQATLDASNGIRVIGDQVWWLPDPSSSPKGVRLSSIHCP